MTQFATIARVYFASPDPNSWTLHRMGAIAFVRDQSRNNTFFIRLVDLGSFQVVWEQELYKDFTYRQERKFFHTFPSDDYMVGLSFAEEGDAAIFFNKVQNRDTNNQVAARAPGRPAPAPGASIPVASSSSFDLKSSGSTKSGKGDKKKLTKADIGLPSNFKHIGHIGWDPDKGFDVQNIPPEWKALFDRAGVTREQLENKETAKFIVDFVQQRGGPAAVAANAYAPPPPPQNRGSAPPPPQSRGAAPPPPQSRSAAPPPPPGRGAAPPPPGSAPPPPGPPGGAPPPPSPPSFAPPAPSFGAPPPPGPPGGAAPPPPPPPPSFAPPPPGPPPPGPPPPPAASGGGGGGGGGGRNALLESIQQGTKLKKAEERQLSAAPAQENDGDMASALAAALASRNVVMRNSSDEEDTNWGEDDW